MPAPSSHGDPQQGTRAQRWPGRNPPKLPPRAPALSPTTLSQASLKCTSNTSSSAVGSLVLCGHAQQAADALILEVIRDRQQSLPWCLDHTIAVHNYIPLLFVLPHSQLPLWPSSLSSSFSFPFCSAPLVGGWQGMVGSQLHHFHSPSLASSVRGAHCQTHQHLPTELS